MKKSAAWYAFREAGLGSSDAPIIMGASPWCTPKQLWLIRTKRVDREPSNWAMARGLKLEPRARQWYENTMGIEMPAAQVIHDRVSYIRANFDGLNRTVARGAEFKCPGAKDHALALHGKIPAKYLWQLVHLALVADLENIDYVSFDGEDGVIIPFRRDRALERQLFPKLVEFWELLQNDIPPVEAELPPFLKARSTK